MRGALTAFGVLAAAFVLVSLTVGLSDTTGTDLAVARAFAAAWNPVLGVAAKAMAMLGGVEVTSLLVLGIAVYLWRHGFRSEVWFLVAFALAEGLEALDKHVLRHPGPGARLSHGDGPSLAQLFEPVTGGNSFPSGHMLRTVFGYGLLAFVVYRLALPGSRRQRFAIPFAAVMILLMAADRLYLEVHWGSDVIGGALLGGLALAAAVLWLDRPRPAGAR